MNLQNWLDYELLGNSILTWTNSFAIFLGAWLVLFLLRRLLMHRLRSLVASSPVTALQVVDYGVQRTQAWFPLLLALFFASKVWDFAPEIGQSIAQITLIGVVLQVGIWLSAALTRFLAIRRDQEIDDNPSAVAAMDVLAFVARVGVWSVVLLVLLDNLGIDVTTLLAGLGVGGIAVALAAQSVLGDLFASLSIVLDKPFVVGDFLIIDDLLGSVEKVGIKTTRVRSLSGEQLVFSNNDLLASRIRNYGRMTERRVVFSLGVTYETAPEKLKKIPFIIRESIAAKHHVRFDRAHFQKYGDFALLFEAVYYVLLADYNRYMDIQQAINLDIFEKFAEEGISFAYPTQTLYLAKTGP